MSGWKSITSVRSVSSEKSLSKDTLLQIWSQNSLANIQGLMGLFLVQFWIWYFYVKLFQTGTYSLLLSKVALQCSSPCEDTLDPFRVTCWLKWSCKDWLPVFQSFSQNRNFDQKYPTKSVHYLVQENHGVPVEEATHMHCLNLFDALLSQVKWKHVPN
jgi:hypothetical protein